MTDMLNHGWMPIGPGAGVDGVTFTLNRGPKLASCTINDKLPEGPVSFCYALN